MNKFQFIILIILISCLTALVGCAGDSGFGSSGATGDTGSDTGSAGDSAVIIASMVQLEQDAMDGTVSDEEYITQLEQVYNAIDAEDGGTQNLADYLESTVIGKSIDFTYRKQVYHVHAISDSINNIKNSETYQMLEAFVTSVASNVLLPDPLGLFLDLAQPDNFCSIAAIQTRTHNLDANFSNQIDAVKAGELKNQLQYNPFHAERELLKAIGRTLPAWLTPVSEPCLRDCGTGSTSGQYSGNFAGTLTETGLGCVWKHAISGAISVEVSGSGTLANPYEGTFDVSGTVVTTLSTGSYCDPGGTGEIWVFSGSVDGSSGKLNSSGEGMIGAASISAMLWNATVSSTSITGSFIFDMGVDDSLTQTVTLTKE